MSRRLLEILAAFAIVFAPVAIVAQQTDASRDILVTFENSGARMTTSSTPYRARKRYTITAEAKRQARAVAAEYALQQVDHWPIKALSVYCFVYRVADGEDREDVIDKLRADARVESVQPLNVFETSANPVTVYDDTYADMQHGLDTLDLTRAHRYTRGAGVRIAVIDSDADTNHEDLAGRIRRVVDFADQDAAPDRHHGTAVTSVIGANANNAKGIVGVAPEAKIDLYVACWSDAASNVAVCDSFTLAKALDTVLERPPDVLNLSLAGPADALLRRLLLKALEQDVIVIAARPSGRAPSQQFPASMSRVIAVGSSTAASAGANRPIYAPGEQILVAVPGNKYDFRSGSSLAAAHASGVVALMLALSPGSDTTTIRAKLTESQFRNRGEAVSINACKALSLTDRSLNCGS
ncbi:MAG: S8 family peptidase [Woeseiaceae bacterium]